MSSILKSISALFAVCLTIACNTMDFSEDITGTPQMPQPGTIPPPCGTGLGTSDQPYTVEDFLLGRNAAESSSCWIIGYVVGATYQSISNAEFNQETSYTTNILLAADSTCKKADQCIPIELKGTQMQKTFALPHNPSGFRQCAMFYGLPGKYFKKPGLRNTSSGVWLYGFDISSITPENWQTDSIP